ncbi:MAG: serpin family protein [Candidatus Omnitrophica bacterium]|nr:serpin family protein [Candidatus Omnitrophota bacterium]
MRKFWAFCVVIVALAGVGGNVSAQTLATLSESNNQFAFNLYQRYAARGGNVFFSPYSLATALGMTYEGARGKTADEMRTVLGFSADDAARRAATSEMIGRLNVEDPLFELTMANALWAQKGFSFLPDYLKMVKTVYGGEARSLDFFADAENSRITINSWVAEQTRDRIKDLLPERSLNSSTRLVLTNAVYFKGQWQTAFDKSQTTLSAFWLSPETFKDVAMMHKLDSFAYGENDAAQFLELPYKGDELSMIVILPKDRTAAALAAGAWQVKMAPEKVSVSLPSFEFGEGSELSDDLKALGMASAFGQGADFSGMTGKPDLYIGAVYHKAWIKVNEEGTEAAAATAVTMEDKAVFLEEAPPKVFYADRPFIFMIQDRRSGQILFMGRVTDPAAQ